MPVKSLNGIIFLFALVRFKFNPITALLSVVTTLTQMAGYGFGFIANAWTVLIRGKKEGVNL